MKDRVQSNRQVLGCSCSQPFKIGIFKTEKTGKFFFGDGRDAGNRVMPSRVWTDEDGFICVEVGTKNECIKTNSAI